MALNEEKPRKIVFIGSSHFKRIKPYLMNRLEQQHWFTKNFELDFIVRPGGKVNDRLKCEIKELIKGSDKELILFFNYGGNDVRVSRKNVLGKLSKSVDDVFHQIVDIHKMTASYANTKDVDFIMSGLIPDALHDNYYKPIFSELSKKLRLYSEDVGILYFSMAEYLTTFGNVNFEMYEQLSKRELNYELASYGTKRYVPMSYHKSIHLNDTGMEVISNQMVNFLRKNFAMQSPKSKITWESGGVSYKGRLNCDLCREAFLKYQHPDPDEKIDLDSILFQINQLIEYEPIVRNFELYKLAVDSDSTGYLKRIEIAMPDVRDLLVKYIVGKKMHTAKQKWFYPHIKECVRVFTENVKTWGKTHIYYQLLSRHVCAKAQHHFKILLSYICKNKHPGNTDYAKRYIFACLLENYEMIISIVRNILADETE